MKTLFLMVIIPNYACASKVEKATLTEQTDNLLKLWNAFNFGQSVIKKYVLMNPLINETIGAFSDMSLSRAGLHIQLGNPGARGSHKHEIDGSAHRDANGGMAPSAPSSGYQTSDGATYQSTVAGQVVTPVQVVPPGQVSVQQPAQVIHFTSGHGQGSELGGRSESGLNGRSKSDLNGSSKSDLNGRSAETGSAGQQKMAEEHLTGRSPEPPIPVKVPTIVPYIEPPNIPLRPKAIQPVLMPYPNVYMIDHKPHVLVPLPVTHPLYKDYKSLIVFPTGESPMSGSSMAGLPKVDLKNGKVSTSGESTSGESTSGESTSGESTSGVSTSGESTRGESTSGESADESSSVLESTAAASKLIQSKFEQSKNQLSAFSIPTYKSSTSNQSVFVTKIMTQSSF